ncbi:hypothetical protein EV644_1542 [Kribbella orskensis]|uniref:HEAT repeat protein n=1 Tax=Kribbella orskensis TaxID=2512216 RepID=A0ABY2B7Y3_9ACTN|nr:MULTISPECIES: hypothetical protein [Kribbella]TCN27664.1 hypothetical protein EV642_1562 [Kribbella sp. VKM Ac-2500]TCO07580.1 hypothetical protein EV644_1542 [Kribbella orskensis]
MRADDDLGYEAPTKQQVADALLVLGADEQHRRLFYQGLQNPLWVEPLDKLGAFDDVPAPFEDAEGNLRSKVWSEGEYLVRMAEFVPSKVTPILVRMATTEDPFARRMVVSATARLDGENAAKLSKIVGEYLSTDRSRLVPPQEIVRIMEALMTDGKWKQALHLASCAFGPREATGTDGKAVGFGEGRVVVGIDDFAYSETLASVSIAMAPLGARWLAELQRWLQRYQVLARGLEAAGDDSGAVETDRSYVWRPSITAHEQNNHFDDVGNGLVDALRDAAIRALADGLPVVDVVRPLMESRQPLLRRVGIHLITVAVGLGLDSAQSLAADVLGDEQYLDVDYRHEYAEFARRVLPVAASDVVAAWTRTVLDGPTATDDEIRGWLSWRFPETDVPQEAVDERRRVWQMRILSSIATDMPEAAVARLTDLQAEFGEWEHAEFPRFVSSGVGEKAPGEVDDIASWSLPEVVAFLRSWSEPVERVFHGPTYGGVTFALMQDVKARPIEYAKAAGIFADTDLRYIAALFNAFREIADSGAEFLWASLVRLGASLVEMQPAEAIDGDIHGRGSDLASVHDSLLSMLLGGLSAGGDTKPVVDVDAWPDVVRIVSALSLDPDPTPEHEAEYGGSNMDPLTLSMNTVRPNALRVAARLARFSSGMDERGTSVPEVNKAALDVLDGRLGSERDSSLTVAAVYGEALSSLAWSNSAWTRERLARLFEGDGDYTSVVMSTVLAAYTPSAFLLDLLRPWLAQWLDRLANDEPVKVGYESHRSATESLGDHLTLLAARGEIELDDPLLLAYYARVDVAARSTVLGHLGWMLLHEKAPEEFLARARAIWDWRANAVEGSEDQSRELSGFYWWVRCGQFSPTWWMPRLVVASQVPGFDGRGMIGEQIAEAAQADPRAAFGVLAALLKSGEGDFERYDLIENAPAVFAAALDVDDVDLTARAEALLNDLGRAGHLTMLQRVNELRARG